MEPKAPAPEIEHARKMILTSLSEDFGDNLSRAARALGMTQGFLSDLRAMKKTPGTDTLIKFANYKGISVDAVLGRTAEVPESAPPELDAVLRRPPPTGRKGVASQEAVRAAIAMYRSDGSSRTEEEWARLLDDLTFVSARHQKVRPRVLHDDPTVARKKRKDR